MSEDRRNADAPSAENSQFFRRYDVCLGNDIIVTEFDYGFLSPARKVYHAHNHAAFELIAVSKGISIIDIKGKPYTCREGTVLLIPRGVYHSNRQTEIASERFCFRFYPKKGLMRGVFYLLGKFLAKMNEPEQFEIPELFEILAAIRREMLENAPAKEEMIDSLLREIYIHVLRHVIRRTGTQTVETLEHSYPQTSLAAERLKMIERFFSQRYADPVVLKDLADVLYISPTQVNRILTEKYGQTFREKLRDTRLHQAKLLLESTNLSISTIAVEVGYTSVAGFFSAFRKTFGITPAEYRITVKQSGE